MKKSKKIKAPKWFEDLYIEAEEERKDLFEYLSGVIGYGPEWCEKNIKTCLERLEQEDREHTIERLGRLDTITRYAWFRFYYENWNEIKDFIKRGVSEYNLRKKIIKFSTPNIFQRFSGQAGEFKKKIRDGTLRKKIKDTK